MGTVPDVSSAANYSGDCPQCVMMIYRNFIQ